MTDSEQVRCFVILIMNKSRYLSLYVATLGYKIDENNLKKLCGRPSQYAPAPCKLTYDLLTLKVVSESRVR